jgi:hypothetical protein
MTSTAANTIAKLLRCAMMRSKLATDSTLKTDYRS